MTPEQANIAIAKICNWRSVPGTDILIRPGTDNKEVAFKIGRGGDEPHNYFGDLNAMRKAVEYCWLGDGMAYHNDAKIQQQYKSYCALLDHDVDAPVAKRAEMFLRVHKKWIEPKPTVTND